jgi:tetratricopeptide (TPR) repeat protein
MRSYLEIFTAAHMRKAVLNSVMLVCLALSAPPLWAQRRPISAGDFDQVAARAEQARSANRIEEAIELYRKGLSLRPRWAEGWWYVGALLYERDAFADAAVALSKATALSPKSGTTWVMLGLCEFKLGRFNDALTHIRQGGKLGASADPQFRQVMIYHEGVLLIGKGDFEHAQETLGQLSRDGVENEDVTNALGLSVLHIRFSDLLAGDSTLRQMVLRAGLAETLAAQKKFAAALDEYERLANDFPTKPNVQYALGRYLLTSNDEKRAVVAFQREIENNPSHLDAHLLLANTKLNLKDFPGGLPYAEKAVKLNPQSPFGHYLLGSLLLENDQTARAITELETARRMLPRQAKIYFALGRAYARANRQKDAAAARSTFTRLTKQAEADVGAAGAQQFQSAPSGVSDQPRPGRPQGTPTGAKRKP